MFTPPLPIRTLGFTLSSIAKSIKAVISIGFCNCFRTIIFNFKYLPYNQALHLPIIISGKLEVRHLKKGQIIIEDPKFRVLEFGSSNYPWAPKQTSCLNCCGTMTIKGNGKHWFRQGAIINISPGAELLIGNNFTCAPNLRLTVTNKVVIGNDNMWSYDNIVLDSDIHVITDMNGNKLNKKGIIIFGDRVWMGARCTVLKNVSIADDIIIGSTTVVSKSLLDPNSIYVGPAARKVKTGIKWKRDWVTE